MCEDNLVVAILRVLYVLGVLHVHWDIFVLGLSATRRVEVHGAERRGGDVDVVDVVEHYWLVRVGHGEVLLGFLGHQCVSTVADYLLDQASGGELKEQGHGHAA